MKKILKNPRGLVQVTAGICLIVISLWALFLPPLFPYSTHAIINTKVVTIRAGDEGRIADLPMPRTQMLKAGARVGLVSRDFAKVKRDLEERQLRRAKLQDQVASLDRAIADRRGRLKEAQGAVELARAAARRGLDQLKRSLEDKVRIHREELAEKRKREADIQPLYKDGIVTSAQWSEIRQQTLESEKNLSAAETELASVLVRAEAAGGGANGVSDEAIESALNRIASFEREIGDLSLQRIDLAGELSETESQITLAQSYGEAGRTYELTTPIEGIVWRRQAVDGETLASGQPVVDIADAHALFVEAYFRRDFMNSIAVGDYASVYLIGESRFVNGKVIDVQVQERTDKDTNIINSMVLDTTMLRVTIELEPGKLKPENIGELAKVLTSSGKAGWVDRSLIWLSILLRSHK